MTKLPETKWKPLFDGERPKRPEPANMVDRVAMALADGLDDGLSWMEYREQAVVAIKAVIGPERSIDLAEMLDAIGEESMMLQPGITMTMTHEPRAKGTCYACGKTERTPIDRQILLANLQGGWTDTSPHTVGSAQMNMIEKVARALNLDPGHPEHRNMARAAIEAMRFPDAVMLDAVALHSSPPFDQYFKDEDEVKMFAVDWFAVMIDAAMKEE